MAGSAAVPVGALRVQGVDKRFGTTEVLRDAEVDVRPGEFVTLLGPSGCGKTTLLRIVAGFELPDRGSVVLDGVDITRLPANRRPVNTVFQSYALFPHLSVFENVAFGLRARGVAEAEVVARVGEAMDLLRFAELRDRRPHQLSGGQRQRVALARALVNRPDVLLLDEPMSALDARLRAEVQLELKRLQRRLGTTFVLVTHDQDEAMVVSDRILLMHGGRIVQAGAPREVYERPRTRFVAEFLGAANLIAATRTGQGNAVHFRPISKLPIDNRL
ncbi:MAG: ATP-binding cassette domain-containing protein [Planctomycetes bacterium]|nr:ATP-binding cassette domain-containing protein [Planctomycetota bacterium]